MGFEIKICGLTDAPAIEAAAEAGIDYAGFVFFPKSPRHLEIAAACDLAAGLPASVQRVALTVNADDTLLDGIVEGFAPDMLQLHGEESPQRVSEVRRRYGRPVMKAVLVAGEEDVARADAYRGHADLLLFDAKPPKSVPNALPGGNGLSFDWALIAAARPRGRWLLSGGLTPENVGEAVRITDARGVDVSSGVESAPGRKDPERIRRFVEAAREAATVRHGA